MKRPVLFIVAITMSSASVAQTWVHFANCGGGDQLRSYSYDASSVASEGASRVVNVRGDYSRVRGSRTAEGRIAWTIDCTGRTYVEKSRVELRANGEIQLNYDTPTPKMGIIPDSVADKLAQAVCARPVRS